MLTPRAPRRRFSALGASLAFVLAIVIVAAAGAARAQSAYPDRPVRIIVPSSPGGGTDTVARLIAQFLSDKLGQQFFIENRPGAGSLTGIIAASRAAPDGYTLVMVASTLTSLRIAHPDARLDPINDLTPITEVVAIPNVLVVHPSLPIKTMADLVAFARRQPGVLSYASAGLGSNPHVAMELLKVRAGIDLLHVPYNGVAPALTDVIGGRVPIMMVNAASAKSHIDSGALRPIAVSGASRATLLPDVPTVAQSGVADYEAVQWFGLLAPAGLPEPIALRLYEDVRAAMNTKRLMEWASTEGAEPVVNTPAEFRAVIAAEVARWATLMRPTQ